MKRGVPRSHVQEQADREANHFSMCLLMPEDFVRKEIDKMGGDFDLFGDVPKKLAAKFKVS